MSFTTQIKNELCAAVQKNFKFAIGEFFAVKNYAAQKKKLSGYAKKILEFYLHNNNFPTQTFFSDIKKSTNSKRGFLSGNFICCGIINNPRKNYNLEFIHEKLDDAQNLAYVLESFQIVSKIIPRRKHFVNYAREAEMISKFLSLIGANISFMEFENARILKELRNNVNRSVNFEAANLNKTIVASVDKSNDIEYIISHAGINYLPNDLREIALLRIKFKQASLKEIGEKFSQPISKSSVCHKLKKISKIAQSLRNKKGDKK